MDVARIIEALSTWPGVVAILGASFLFALRKPLSRKLEQLLSISGQGFDAKFGHAEAQLPTQSGPPKDALPPPNTFSPQPPDPNPIYAPLEAETKRRLEQNFGTDLTLQREWAVRMFASVAVEKGHEMAYRLIFGSQIEALQALNQRGAIDLAEGIKSFNDAVAADSDFYRNQNFTFEMWCRFLIDFRYVETSSANLVPGTTATITPLGRDFLVWMAARGVPTAKRG